MSYSFYDKFIEPNVPILKELKYSPKSFAKILKKQYLKELESRTIDSIRKGIESYISRYDLLSDNPLQPEPEITIEAIINLDLAKKAESSKLLDLTKKNIYLLKKIEETERLYNDLLAIKEPINQLIIKSDKATNTKSNAVPIISLSDWHIEENVRKGQVNGFNEYNLAIAEKRAMSVFKNSLTLILKESKEVNIKDAIYWLGGDFISGYIHDELIESNNLSPLQSIRMAKRLLMSGIEYLLKNSKLNFTFPCSAGNHGRNTKKMHISTSSATNYEYMMYADLADLFRNENRVKFHIVEADDCYVKAVGHNIRFFHGEAVKYGGGIGGLTVPLIKYLLRKDEQIKADFTCLGHFHQLFYPTPKCCVNGSLIGLSPYGHKAGFKPERPAQAFTLIDEKRGVTVKIPIFAE